MQNNNNPILMLKKKSNTNIIIYGCAGQNLVNHYKWKTNDRKDISCKTKIKILNFLVSMRIYEFGNII